VLEGQRPILEYMRLHQMRWHLPIASDAVASPDHLSVKVCAAGLLQWTVAVGGVPSLILISGTPLLGAFAD